LLNTLFLLGVLSGAGNDQLSISQIKINDQDDEFMILILIFFFFYMLFEKINILIEFKIDFRILEFKKL
jgi:hypothetical protein